MQAGLGLDTVGAGGQQMTDKAREGFWYCFAMGILFYGMAVIVGRGTQWKDLAALAVWAIAYGGALAGSAYHRGKGEGYSCLKTRTRPNS